MRTLLLLRHAKSSWKDPDLEDHDRPLNKRGRRDAPRMAAWIAESGMAPDLILSSTAVRAVRTAEAVAESCDTQVVYLPELYHAGPHDGFTAMQSAAAYDPEILMWVGHNPGLEAMIDTLTGTFARLPTAALARIDLEIDDWADARPTRLATLVDVWRPREIWTEA